MRLRKIELQLEKTRREKEIIENILSEIESRRRDENDANNLNRRKEGVLVSVLRERDRSSISCVKNDHSMVSMRNINYNENEECKNSDISRKNSFRTNVSKRYQEADDEDNHSKSNNSSSHGSYDMISNTYSRKRTEANNIEKRNTHDIKSLERLATGVSNKSGKPRELSQTQ